MMRFEELTLSGFLSFSDDENVVPLAKRGLVLIEGENRDDPTVDNNGSGKSSISEALLWALFGKTIRGVTGDEVVNRKSKEGCRVQVVFSNDKGERFIVERHRAHRLHKNKLFFTGPKGGLTANETSETEVKITEALGMDFETFTSAVIFGQGQTKHFSSMTDKEMKRVTDKLIGVEAISAAHKRASEDLWELEAELDVLKAEKKDTDKLEADLKAARADETEWEDEHVDKLKEFEKQLASLTPPDLKKLKEEVDERDKWLKASESNYESAKDAVAKLDAAYSVKAAEESRLLKARNQASTKPGKCDRCGSTVTAFDLAAHTSHLQQEHADALRACNAVLDDLNAARKLRQDRKQHAEECRKKLDKAVQALADAKVESAKVEKVKDMLDEFKKQTNPHKKAIARAKDALDEARKHNETVEKAMKAVKAEMGTLGFVTAMLSDKGGGPDIPPLKGLLVESVAPFVNDKLAAYSRVLTDGNVTITFETQKQLKSGEYRDEYRLKVENRYGAEAYEGSSGGERRKIDAAVFFAFQALAASRSREQVRFAVWDEVFDALDETAQEVMMDLLLEERKAKETVFVITQRPELRGYFPRTIKVVKERGFSSVV